MKKKEYTRDSSRKEKNMRVISKDGNISVQYENAVFCLIEDGDEYTIAIRNPSLTGYMPMAGYDDEFTAKKKFKELIDAGASYSTTGVFRLE